MPAGQPPITVHPVEESHWREVLPLLFGPQPPETAAEQIEQLLQEVEAGTISLQGLRESRCGNRRTGCLLTVAQPDGTLFLWPPAIAPEIEQTGSTEGEQSADELLRSVRLQLSDSTLLYAQCLLEPEDRVTAARFRRNGFELISELLFMQADPANVVLSEADRDPAIRLTTLADEVNEQRFAAVIERTWQGTLDCPRFNAGRGGEQALASHRLSGEFRPDLWYLLQYHGEDAAVLLLGDHPDLNAMELVYLGVVPEARGRSLGKLLTQHALAVTRAQGRGSLFLAVDSANHYAVRAYKSCGFIRTARRDAWLRYREG